LTEAAVLRSAGLGRLHRPGTERSKPTAPTSASTGAAASWRPGSIG